METLVQQQQQLSLKNKAVEFMFAYQQKDLGKMLSFCNPEGTVEFLPLGAAGKGKIRSTGRPTQIKLFTDDYFSYLMQDSSGKWNYAGAGAGTYEVNGNTYKEKHLYSTAPENVGVTDWQEFEMQGDTLVFKLFTKVVLANGQDVTKQFTKTVEKRVRAGNNIHL